MSYKTALWAAALTIGAAAQAPAAPQARILVTAHYRKQAAVLNAADLEVPSGDQVVSVEPATGPVELYLAIDDDTAVGFNKRLDVVRQWIIALPDNVSAGVAYLSESGYEVAAPPSSDHAAVAKAVRAAKAKAGVSPSPFDSIAALVSNWQARPGARREMVVISDGIERISSTDPGTSIVNHAVETAEHAGVVAFAIQCGRQG